MPPSPKPGFTFPGPVPREALESFRAKDLRVGFDHRDVWGQEHAFAFTAAKAMQLDLLQDLREGVAAALAEGKTYRRFAAELTPLLQRKGWWGPQERIDPLTGEKRTVQLGSPRRLKTLYRANLRAARAAGQWQRIQRTKTPHPYLLYQLGPSERHRPEHLAWHGTLLPVDDPWWRTHYPPNGWGCRCWVRLLSRREAERRGGARPRPEADPVQWVNKRTGEEHTIDRGLDPAWAGNAGQDRVRVIRERLTQKIDRADQGLARVAIRQVVDSPLLEEFMDKPEGEFPIGILDRGLQRALGAKTQVVRLTPRTMLEQLEVHPDLAARHYRTRLQEVLRRGTVVREKELKNAEDLVFFLRFEGRNDGYKATVRMEHDRRVRLATFHRIKKKRLRQTKRRGIVLRALPRHLK